MELFMLEFIVARAGFFSFGATMPSYRLRGGRMFNIMNILTLE
jgi:hypothetical protein